MEISWKSHVRHIKQLKTEQNIQNQLLRGLKISGGNLLQVTFP